MIAPAVEDGQAIEALVPEAAAGNEPAWWLVWQHIEPTLLRVIGSPRTTGRMSTSEDDVRNILVEVMERLRADDNRRLHAYLDKKRDDPSMQFVPWLIVLAKRVAIDYMRGHGEYIDRRRERDASAAGKWLHQTGLPSDSRGPSARPPVTNRSAAMAMLRYAYAELPTDQVSALELWVINASYGDIATQLELPDAKAAERLVRAALERLRRRFRQGK